MRVGPQLAAIRFSKRGRDKLLGLTNDALLLLFLLADKSISSRPSRLENKWPQHPVLLSLSLTGTFASLRLFLDFSLPFSFAFQAGHLVGPYSIINCALHSIYLSCLFSGKTSVCVRDPHLLNAAYACF